MTSPNNTTSMKNAANDMLGNKEKIPMFNIKIKIIPISNLNFLVIIICTKPSEGANQILKELFRRFA